MSLKNIYNFFVGGNELRLTTQNTTAADVMFIKWWHDIADKCQTAKKKQTIKKILKKACHKLKKYCYL